MHCASFEHICLGLASAYSKTRSFTRPRDSRWTWNTFITFLWVKQPGIFLSSQLNLYRFSHFKSNLSKEGKDTGERSPFKTHSENKPCLLFHINLVFVDFVWVWEWVRRAHLLSSSDLFPLTGFRWRKPICAGELCMPLTSLRPVALTVITGLATVVCLRAITLHIPAFQYVHTECDTRPLLSSACFGSCLSLCLDFVYFKLCATKKCLLWS